MKPCKPNIPAVLELAEDFPALLRSVREQEDAVERLRIGSAHAIGTDAHKLDFVGVEFDHCRLNGCAFDKSSFVDVRFRDCDFSSCSFADAYFSRCEFLSCKWVGAVFSQVRIREVATADNRLCEVNFFHTSLKGMDFTRDFIDGWILSEGMTELKEAIFSPYQAVTLAQLLGIEIQSSER